MLFLDHLRRKVTPMFLQMGHVVLKQMMIIWQMMVQSQKQEAHVKL